MNEIEMNLNQHPKKRLIIEFINVNMGASQIDTARKVVNTLRKKYPYLDIHASSQFYAGEAKWEAIEQSINKRKENKKYSPEKLQEANAHLDGLIQCYLADEQNNYNAFESEITKLTGHEKKLMRYQYNKINDPDCLMLKGYGVNPGNDIPYQPLSELANVMEQEREMDAIQDANVIKIRILTCPTADGNQFSKGNHKLAKQKQEKAAATQNKKAENHFKDFIFALDQVHPTIFISENHAALASDQGTSTLQVIINTLSDRGLSVYQTVIDHSTATASQKKTHFTIGSRASLSPFYHPPVPMKPKTPDKYLYHHLFNKGANVPHKYKQQLQEDKTQDILNLHNGNKMNAEKNQYQIVDRENFVKTLKIFFLLRKKLNFDNKHIILLPQKIISDFTKVNGEQRTHRELLYGLTARLSKKMGRIYFMNHMNHLYDQLSFLYSKRPIAMFLNARTCFFWDIGYHPMLSEMSLINGMSKQYTQLLVNNIKPTPGYLLLRNHPIPKIVAPIIEDLVGLNVFHPGYEQQPMQSGIHQEENLTDTIFDDMGQGINIADYELVAVELPDGKNNILFVLDTTTGEIIDEDILLSDLPLSALEKYLNKECLDIIKKKLQDESNKRSKVVICSSQLLDRPTNDDIAFDSLLENATQEQPVPITTTTTTTTNQSLSISEADILKLHMNNLPSPGLFSPLNINNKRPLDENDDTQDQNYGKRIR